MEKISRIINQRGLVLVWGVLGTFILVGIFLVALQLRQDLRLVHVHNSKNASVQRAWFGLEKFLKDASACTTFFRERKLGDTVVGLQSFGPIIGQEWLNTGHIVQDLYLLRREDEVAWQVKSSAESFDPATGEALVYVKVSLVARPPEGRTAGVDYLLSAPTVTRIFPLRVSMAQVKVFRDCDPARAQEACQQAAFELGAVAQMAPAREPASEGERCGHGRPHVTQCVLPGEQFPIQKCL